MFTRINLRKRLEQAAPTASLTISSSYAVSGLKYVTTVKSEVLPVGWDFGRTYSVWDKLKPEKRTQRNFAILRSLDSVPLDLHIALMAVARARYPGPSNASGKPRLSQRKKSNGLDAATRKANAFNYFSGSAIRTATPPPEPNPPGTGAKRFRNILGFFAQSGARSLREERNVHQRACAKRAERLAFKQEHTKEQREAFIAKRREEKRRYQAEADYDALHAQGGLFDVLGTGAAITASVAAIYTGYKLYETSKRVDSMLDFARSIASQIRDYAQKMKQLVGHLWMVPVVVLAGFIVSVTDSTFVRLAIAGALAIVLGPRAYAFLIEHVPSLSKEDLLEKQSGTTDLVSKAVAVVMAFSVFGDKKKDTTWMMGELMKRIGQAPRTQEGIEAMVRWLVAALRACYNHFATLTGRDRIPGPHDAVTKWRDDVLASFTKHSATGSKLDSHEVMRLANLVKEGEAYASQYFRTDMEASIRTTLAMAAGLVRPYLGSINARNNFRPEPVCMALAGKPGVGKTRMVMALAASVAKLGGLVSQDADFETIKANVWQKGDAKFWEGYVGQEVLVMDDAFQEKAVPGSDKNDYMMLIRAISSWTFPLDYAALDSKGKVTFASNVVLITTNAMSIAAEAATVIREPAAVVRRITFPYVIVVKEEYRMPGTDKIDYARFMQEERACADRPGLDGFPWYIWQAVPHNFMTGLATGDAVEMRTVVERVIETVRVRQAVAKEEEARMCAYVDGLNARVKQGGKFDGSEQRTKSDNPVDARIWDGYVEHPEVIERLIPNVSNVDLRHALMEALTTIRQGPILTDLPHEVAIGYRMDREAALCMRVVRHVVDEVMSSSWSFRDRRTLVLDRLASMVVSCLQDAERIRKTPRGDLWSCSDGIVCPRDMADLLVDFHSTLRAGISVVMETADMLSDEALRRFNPSMLTLVSTAPVFAALANTKYCGMLATLWSRGITAMRERWSIVTGWVVRVGKFFKDPVNLFMIAGVAGACYAGVKMVHYMFFRTDLEKQSNTPAERPMSKYRRFGTLKGGVALAIQHKHVRKTLRKENGADRVAIADAGYRNCYKLAIPQVTVNGASLRRTLGQVMFIRDRVAMMPTHFLHDVQDMLDRGYVSSGQPISLVNAAQPSININMPISVFLALSSTSVEDADVSFVEFPHPMRAHRDLVKFFVNESDVQYLGALQSRLDICRGKSDKQEFASRLVVQIPSAKLVRDVTYSGITIARGFMYKAETSVGDCGAPLSLVAGDSMGCRAFFGIHVAGSSSYSGISTVVTSEMVLAALDKFGAIEDRFEEDLTSRGVGFEAESGEFEFIKSFDTFQPLGVVDRPVSLSPNSKLFRTELYGTMGECLDQPAKLRPFVDRSDPNNPVYVNPMLRALEPYGGPLFNTDSPLLNQAVRVATAPLFERTRNFDRSIYSFEQAVLGVPQMKFRSIPRSTSPGYPYILDYRGGKKAFFGSEQDYDLTSLECVELEQRVAHIISEAKKGVRLSHIFTDFLKDELRSPEKVIAGKTRLISSAPLDYTIAWRQYFGAFSSAVFLTTLEAGMAPGMCAYTQWGELATQVRRLGDLAFDGDFKGFDSSQQPTTLAKFVDVVNEWYDDGPENARVRNVLWLDLIHSRHIGGPGYSQKYIYQWMKSMPSGHPFTTIVNSLFTLTMLVAAYIDKTGDWTGFWENVSPMVYGDDNIVNVRDVVADRYNQAEVAESLQRLYGMQYTSGRKDGKLGSTATLTDLTFLKRGFRFECGWDCPLEIDSFLYPVYWCKNKLEKEHKMREDLERALEELSMHDATTWARLSPLIARAMDTLGHRSRCPFTRQAYRALVATRKDNWY